MFSQQARKQRAVPNIAMTENMLCIGLHGGKVFCIAGVGQFVQVDHRAQSACSQSSTKLAPMKPAPPVTSILSGIAAIYIVIRVAIHAGIP